MKRRAKLTSLAEAAQTIQERQRLALGGFAIYQRPMAFTYELVRQKKNNLTLVGIVNAIEADLLIGAGAVSRIETSYVGLEKYGLARNFRRAVEAGELEVVDYPELLAWDRFRASQEGLPFWPCTFLGGSGIVKYNQDIKPFTCPVTGRQMWAVPPAAPDVVVVHAPIGDEYGNVAIHARKMLPQSVDITLTRACDTVIVTVEKIVTSQELKKQPHLVEIPAFRTSHIVEAPFGAYPTAVPGIYDADEDALAEYVTASSTVEGFADWLAESFPAQSNHSRWLDRIGVARLLALRNTEIPA
ncbi:CoA transferase subunit A [Pantoea sp. BAV 3049]|uniref:CoA transferase subunit A n=1 Tax=Pantoea sp. BAV 3049 TaxID=2654188 RepID=UPI00131ACD39|nr:CoA-transferase [Pantoea sp. BAV 3049]